MRASRMALSIWGWLMSLSMTIPSIKHVSSILPPTLPSTLIRSRFTSRRSRSATASTALTHISANCRLWRPTILEDSVVMHVRTSGSMSSREKVNSVAIESRRSVATRHAFSYPSAMRSGWMPMSRRGSAISSREPARTTTPVVPSPIS